MHTRTLLQFQKKIEGSFPPISLYPPNESTHQFQSKMSAIDVTVDTVLEQFSLLDFKEQQKFSAAMTRHLQGAPKKVRKTKSDDEEKVKREPSEGMKAWHSLVSLVRETVKTEINPEKNVQTPILAVAGRFKENGNLEPDTEEIIDLYNQYVASPWESATAKKRAAKGSETSSVASASNVKIEPKKVDAKKPEVKKVDAKKPEVKKAPKKTKPVLEDKEEDEIVEKEPVVIATPTAPAAPEAKKDPYPSGSTEDDTPPMAFERKMLGGQKVKMSKKPWPAHCWSQSSGDYLGVWDDSKKEFDTNYDDPCAE